MPRMLTRAAAIVFGVGNLITAALLVLGVFVALPARWWPVDAVAAGLTGLEFISGVALLADVRVARRLTAVAAAAALALGTGVVTTLALTASWLAGVYGPVGRGGALILVLVSALTLPYFVVWPAIQLAWTRLGRDS
jgi:hypothetical protein